jgi:hypothetical protein
MIPKFHQAPAFFPISPHFPSSSRVSPYFPPFLRVSSSPHVHPYYLSSTSSCRAPPHRLTILVCTFRLIISHFSLSSRASPPRLLSRVSMSSTKSYIKSSAWLITELTRELNTFNNNNSLLTHQEKRFKSYKLILLEDQSSLAIRSSQDRSRRVRNRDLLVNVFRTLGKEVFVLCIISTAPTNLSVVDRCGLIPELQKWWINTSHPRALAEVAAELCAIPGLLTGFAYNSM